MIKRHVVIGIAIALTVTEIVTSILVGMPQPSALPSVISGAFGLMVAVLLLGPSLSK